MSEKINIELFIKKNSYEITHNEVTNICDEEYYLKKFPKFKKNVHVFLAKCSASKMHDYRMNEGVVKVNGHFIVEYN